MKTIAFFHNKGGVGKTTACINIAAALAREDKRVLVVDLDSQANATYGTGLIRFLDEEGDHIRGRMILQVLTTQDATLERTARSSRFNQPEVEVIPSHIELSRVEDKLTRNRQNMRRLGRKLEVEQEWDYVLIDAPPSLNVFARAALFAADALVIPSDLKVFANEGLDNVRSFIEDVDRERAEAGYRPLRVLGVLPTKVTTNAKLLKNVVPSRIKRVEERYGFPVFAQWLHEREALAKCMEHMALFDDGEALPDPRSVFVHAPSDTACTEVREATRELIRRLGV